MKCFIKNCQSFNQIWEYFVKQHFHLKYFFDTSCPKNGVNEDSPTRNDATLDNIILMIKRRYALTPYALTCFLCRCESNCFNGSWRQLDKESICQWGMEVMWQQKLVAWYFGWWLSVFWWGSKRFQRCTLNVDDSFLEIHT